MLNFLIDLHFQVYKWKCLKLLKMKMAVFRKCEYTLHLSVIGVI